MTLSAAGPGPACLLLDVGNVLVRFDHRRVAGGIASHLGEPRRGALADVLHRWIFEEPAEDTGLPPNALLDRGDRDLRWLHARLEERFHPALHFAQLSGIWSSIFDDPINEPLVQRALALERQQTDVWICSSTNEGHWVELTRRHPFLREREARERCALSYRLRRLKTEDGFFNVVARATGHPPSSHLLLDDRPENCAAASAAGLMAASVHTFARAAEVLDACLHREGPR